MFFRRRWLLNFLALMIQNNFQIEMSKNFSLLNLLLHLFLLLLLHLLPYRSKTLSHSLNVMFRSTEFNLFTIFHTHTNNSQIPRTHASSILPKVRLHRIFQEGNKKIRLHEIFSTLTKRSFSRSPT